ncbi:MAG TPA: lamin tail domain-containing protein [Anaerolineae bacterium]|nr:lamin tail domain-containing protein [Anaerolineae bacterium]
MKSKWMTVMLSLALAGLFGVLPAFAAPRIPETSSTVVINEIKPVPSTAGNPATNDDEWIELFVVSSSSIDITGWVLTDQDSSDKGSTCNSFAGCNYIFPQVGGSNCSVAPGDYVLVYTGSGTNSCTGAIKKFYMGASQAIWNNGGDDVGLYRPDNACTTNMVVNSGDTRSSQNYRPVDYMAYGSGSGVDNYPDGIGEPVTACTPVADWDWSDTPSAPTNAQTLALTPNGVDTDDGTDWEIAGSGTAPGPITYATTAGGTPGWNNNNQTLAVTLAEFYAQQVADHVRVAWETVSELDNRGFNLYRGTSPDGWDRQLNATLIPSQSQGNPGGFAYTWDDRADLVSGTTYYYWLEDVALSGATALHGPVSVDFTAPTAVTLDGVAASPAAGAAALPWLWVAVAAGAALALGRRR